MECGGNRRATPGESGRPKIWLANVGANAAHPFFSPRFEDGTFELVPIPESPPAAGPHSVVFADVPSFNDPTRTLGRWVPERFRETATHYDPEFGTFTYGDNVERNARAAALKGVRPGDVLFFIVRLADRVDGVFNGRFGFYLAGFLQVESILPGVRSKPSGVELDRYGANAHIRRGLNASNDLADHWDGFWVFGGSGKSHRFRRAVPVDRSLAERVFRRADGGRWRWNPKRTELQTIGSYTRACRCVIDTSSTGGRERAALLWSAVEALNPGVRPD